MGLSAVSRVLSSTSARPSDSGFSSTFNRSLNEGSYTRASDATAVNLSMGSMATPSPATSLSKGMDGSPPRISDGGLLRASDTSLRVSDTSARRSIEAPSPVAPDVLPPIKGTRLMNLSQTVTVKPKVGKRPSLRKYTRR